MSIRKIWELDALTGVRDEGEVPVECEEEADHRRASYHALDLPAVCRR